jgi:DNA adenine methylase
MDLFSDLLDLGGDELIDKNRQRITKAPFGLPGGKSKSVKHIIPHMPIRDVWCDVFGGSGVVSWNYPLTMLNVYNDACSGTVDFYRCIQNRDLERQLIEQLTRMPSLSREAFLDSRDTWCTETDPIMRAAKWYYMVQCSVIAKRQAFARATHSVAPLKLHKSLKTFETIHLILQNFQIENLDWRVCLADFDSPTTVFYLDPPYVGTDQRTYANKFTLDHLKELLRTIGKLDGFVALSHYDSALIDGQDYWTNKLKWSVRLTSDTQDLRQGLGNATEYLWIKE